jgi:hypothetical protein
MGSSPKAPAAPDPAATAAAQTASNKETAYWNASLNNVNQITPYGNLTYKQTGGGRNYNMNAYNAALDAYSKQPAQTTSGLQGYSRNRYGDFQDAQGNRISEGTYNALSGANTQRAVAPKLEDFFTGESAPQFTSTIDLNPESQKLLDTQMRSQNALAGLGEQQIGRIQSATSTPFSFSGLGDAPTAQSVGDASKRAEEALMSRLNPQFQRDEEALRGRLINQGIGQNSEAYNREMERFNQAQTDARMQSVLQGANYGGTLQDQAMQRRNQGINEYTTQRNAPLNEYSALTSGTQVQNPQFTNGGNYTGTQPVDYASMVNNQYQSQLGQYNANVAGRNSTQNALFGLGGQALGGFLGSQAGSAAIAGLFSDARLKENITNYGVENGHKTYEFNYIGNPKKYIGVMAQDIIKTNPEAIAHDVSGFMRVNYDMLGLKMAEVI